MKKNSIKICQYLTLLLLHSSAFAQINSASGGRLTALGKSCAIKDIWNINNNVAGIGEMTSPTIALSYCRYSLEEELSSQAMVVAIPLKKYISGISFQRYGIQEYNEITAGFAVARKYGDRLFIGLKVNYHQLKLNNYGSSTGFSIDVGAIYELTDKLIIGLSLINPSQQHYKMPDKSIPSIIQFGSCYQIGDKVMLTAGISKVDKFIDVSLGIEYQLLSELSFRTATTLKPFRQYAGFGLNLKKLKVDVAIESNPTLNYSPQISLNYAF